MAKKPELEELYRCLIDSRFSFSGRGKRELSDIYSAVKRQFPRLCDDNYRCADNCTSGHPEQPEWKHTTRNALNRLRKLGHLRRDDQRGAWILNDGGRHHAQTRAAPKAKSNGQKQRKALEIATISQRGAGFGTPEENRRVEKAAIRLVTRHFKAKEWEVRDVSSENRGYDLICKVSGDEQHVEVKGARGKGQQFVLTAKEFEAWTTDRRFVLAFVGNALSDKPSLLFFPCVTSQAEFLIRPLSYIAKRKPSLAPNTDARKKRPRRLA